MHALEPCILEKVPDAPRPGEHLERGIPRGIPKCSKLKIQVTLHFPNGASKEAQVLVDTGAEVNVIHPRLVDPSLFRESQRPLRLGMANEICLSGGKREVDFVLGMKGVDVDTNMPMEIRVPMSAYDGEMVCDLIVSYTWLAQLDALVNPRRHGILLNEGDRMVWVAGLLLGNNGKRGPNGEMHGELPLLASPMAIVEEPMDVHSHMGKPKKMQTKTWPCLDQQSP